MKPTNRAASPSPATNSPSDIHSSAQANVWNAEISMKRTRIIRETIVSSSWLMSSGSRRAASAPGRPGPNPIRASIASMSSSSHDRSKAMSRAANHMSLWPASSSQPASSRPCASKSPRPRWSVAVPPMSSTKCRCSSFGCSRRMLAPNPSTVPIRVNVAIKGSGTPAPMRNRACSTLGKERSHHSSGTSMSSVENCAQFCSPHAAMAGNRNFVRGETYRPSSSNPP